MKRIWSDTYVANSESTEIAIADLMSEQQGAQQEATALGCQMKPLDDQLQPTTQVSNFNLLLTQKVSANVVYPIVPKALGPSLSKAEAQGVPVVADSTPAAASQPLPTGFATRVLQGFDTEAYDRVKYIAGLDPGTTFAVIGLAQPVASLEYFTQRRAVVLRNPMP